MDGNQVEVLEKSMEDTWDVPEDRKTASPSHSNIKKEYSYSKYREVLLFALHEPTAEGYRFIVKYTPTGVCFGFKEWKEADAFAKGRKAHVSAFNDLSGA